MTLSSIRFSPIAVMAFVYSEGVLDAARDDVDYLSGEKLLFILSGR